MEEVDNIIIDSLRNIKCDIDEDITSLKGFSPDLVVSAIVCCLESIIHGLNLPKKMPTSMSLRLKLATELVEHIQHVGFRGDIGYQTILYSNEVEVRRVLMFLIERLPREISKIASTETTGYVPRLVKEIEDKVKLSLHKPWAPANILYLGARNCDTTYFQQSFGHSVPLQTEVIEKPDTKNSTEELKQYWVHNLPEVGQQCSKNNLIASLLFKDNEFSVKDFKLKEYLCSNKVDDFNIIPIPTIKAEIQTESSSTENNTPINEIEIKISETVNDIETEKVKYINLQSDFKNIEAKLTQILSVKSKEEDILKDSLTKLKIKSKTLTILSKEENLEKLKNLVENGNDRLLDLASQWNDVQSPLIEQYRSLQTSLSQHELKMQGEKEKFISVKNKNKTIEFELIDKDSLEQRLVLECEKINKNMNRSSYTRRILEIIANIKKQNGEINKILKDTKEVQREINHLTGQLDRSFTLSDALIFNDAKQDEVARKAYKLLATLHFDCESVIQSVTDIGLVERESRNLQEQIDAENDKDILHKLQRVNDDIDELRKESLTLTKKMMLNT